MSSSNNKVVNVERRTWDTETFEARAQARAAAEGGATTAATAGVDGAGAEAASSGAAAALKRDLEPVAEKEEFVPSEAGRAGPMGSERAFLKSRTRRVDLESKLGSSELIDPAAASVTKTGVGGDGAAPLTPGAGVTKTTDGVGWHCRVCDCFLKDSLTYLDHINGRKHQRHLGYTMRAEKSTTAEVGGLLRDLAEQRREREGAPRAAAAVVNFEDAVRQKDAEALRRKAARARRREERKRREKEEGADTPGRCRVVPTGEGGAEDLAGNDTPAEEKEEEEEGGGVDPNLAAMMGFSGFGGSRK